MQIQEWLVTNGLGGYGMGSALGAPLRRAHSLLTLPLRPPLRRAACVRTLFDAIYVDQRWFQLAPEIDTTGKARRPHETFKIKFTLQHGLPHHRIAIGPLEISRMMWMHTGENALYVQYRMTGGDGPLPLRLMPALSTEETFFATPRAAHAIRILDSGFSYALENDGDSRLFCSTDSAARVVEMNRVRPLYFQDSTEEIVWCPAAIDVTLAGDSPVTLCLGLQESWPQNAQESLQATVAYRRRLVAVLADAESFVQRCVQSADAYLITRPTSLSRDTRTVLAGYPRRSETGFDSLMAISGLLLPAGRFDEAIAVLNMLRRHEKDGLVPDFFSEKPEQPVFARMDTSLWYVQTVYDIWQETGDLEFVEGEFSFLLKILNTYLGGTRTGIAVDSDGLVMIGEHAQARSWMDAGYLEWEAVPRIGKPVEVQMLWYNALMVINEFSRLLGREAGQEKTGDIAAKVQESFAEKFWLAGEGYCADLLRDEHADSALRANQLIGFGLPYAPVTESNARSVLAAVDAHLRTPMGIRTLTPYHPAYSGEGEHTHPHVEASARFNGRIHTWLLWPYIRLALRCGTPREQLKTYFAPLFATPDHGLLDHVDEQFAGDAPHTPAGLPASVAALAAITRSWLALTR